MTRSDEALTEGDLNFRNFMSEDLVAIFTLESSGGKRLWYTVFPDDDIGEAESVEDLVSLLVATTLDAIHVEVPSLIHGQLLIGTELGRAGEPEIVGSGRVQFLASEWESLTSGPRNRLRSES